MDEFDLFRVGLTVVMFTLLLVFAVRQWRARALARAEPAVQATVVISVRDMTGSRSYRCFVDTAFDVPGRGVLMHRRGFQTEGKALLFSRLHKEGSVHWVVPNAIETDKVFLRDDLKRSDWGFAAQVAIMGALVGYMVYLVIVEYWMGE